MAETERPLFQEKTWKEFRDSGFFWFCNRLLHLFGWALVHADDTGNGDVIRVFPARITFRGFPIDLEQAGFLAVSNYLKVHAAELANETLPEDERSFGGPDGLSLLSLSDRQETPPNNPVVSTVHGPSTPGHPDYLGGDTIEHKPIDLDAQLGLKRPGW